jgi:hypothetical protein
MSLEEASIIVCAMEEHIKKNPRKVKAKKLEKEMNGYWSL